MIKLRVEAQAILDQLRNLLPPGDESGYLTRARAEFAQVLGVPPESLAGKPVRDVWAEVLAIQPDFQSAVDVSAIEMESF